MRQLLQRLELDEGDVVEVALEPPEVGLFHLRAFDGDRLVEQEIEPVLLLQQSAVPLGALEPVPARPGQVDPGDEREGELLHGRQRLHEGREDADPPVGIEEGIGGRMKGRVRPTLRLTPALHHGHAHPDVALVQGAEHLRHEQVRRVVRGDEQRARRDGGQGRCGQRRALGVEPARNVDGPEEGVLHGEGLGIEHGQQLVLPRRQQPAEVLVQQACRHDGCIDVFVAQEFEEVGVGGLDQTVQAAEQLGALTADMLSKDTFAASDLFRVLHHDYATFTHSANVAFYCGILAAELGYGRDDIERVTTGGLLHDLGKLEIEPTILCKPGRLSEAEFRRIRMHPVLGFRQLARREDLVEGQLMMAYQHHERLDGKGYPVGSLTKSLMQFFQPQMLKLQLHLSFADLADDCAQLIW